MASETASAATDDTEQSLVDVALEYIRDRIVSGEAAPGDRLKERELVERIGISRVPIREALRALSSEGFVTLSPRRGAVVARLELRDLDQIFEIREALETLECVLATEKASQAEVDRLLRIADDADQALAAGDTVGTADANLRFHDVLVSMSHNDVLARMLEPLQNRLHWLLRQNDNDAQLCREHRAIAEAIAARDVRRAKRLALAHVRTSRKVAIRRLFGASAA